MTKFVRLLFFLLCIENALHAQTFLNGDFENNTAVTDQINLANATYNSLMANSFAFGNCSATGGVGDMDIITSAGYCGFAPSGNWYVALTGGGSDAISLTLSSPLVAGNSYTISFYDQLCGSYLVFPIQIGLSTVNNSFGTVINTQALAPVQGVWTQRIFTFVAPNNGQFITVQQSGGQCIDSWAQIDNFKFECSQTLNLGNDTSICAGQNLVLNATAPNTTYLWQDNSTNATFIASQAGTYWVEVTDTCGTFRDSIIISNNNPPAINFGNDTSICGIVNLQLNATSLNSTYVWQNNSTNATFNVTQPGTYWVEITNSCGTASDTIIISANQPPAINLGNDTTICTGTFLVLDATTANSTYIWQDNSTNAVFNASQPGTYWVDVTSPCGTKRDSIIINTGPLPSINLGNDTSVCTGINIILDATTVNSTYAWQDNSANATFNVNQSGIYWVTVSNGCGNITDTINVNYQSVPQPLLGPDANICQGQSLLLNPNTANVSYHWNDNSSNPTYNVTQPGIYWVDVSNICGSFRDSIEINFDPLPVVNLGNDTSLCNGSTLILDATILNGTYLWQDNSSSSTFSVSQSGTFSVQVSNNCGMVADNIVINYLQPPSVDLGNDTTLCEGNMLSLNAAQMNVSYVWQDNSTNAFYNVTQSGNYQVVVTNNCGAATDAIQVTFNLKPVVDLGNDTSLCVGDQLLLNAGNPNYSFVWQDNSTNRFLTISQQGTYWVKATLNNCSNTDSIKIVYNQFPVVDLGVDTVLCQGDILHLNVSSPGAVYTWQDHTTLPFYDILTEGSYWVTVTANNCSSGDTINIKSVFGDCNCVPYNPNSFTPNADGINEGFKINFNCPVVEYNLSVFNRWGEKIFETTDVDKAWDGVYNGIPSPIDVYVFTATYRFNMKDGEEVRSGRVNLIR